MYNSRIILLVNFFIAIYFSTMETEATRYFLYAYDDEITEQKAVNYLLHSEASEVLPLILMLDKSTKELSPPQRLDEVYMYGRRMIEGTQFSSKNNGIQMFFCPSLISGENCLVPKEFKEKSELACLKEFKPLVRKAGDNLCGAGDIGKSHTVLYDICPGLIPIPVNQYKTKEIPLYELCFDANNPKTIFTSHTIGYPELLDSIALRPEHDVKFSMEPTNGFIPSNIQELKDALEQDEGQMAKIPNYKTQKLTPPEDLVFLSSRKSTYRFYNAALQHITLFPLWNEMNENIRNHAKKMYFNEGVRFFIKTGLFDLTSTPREDGQESNVWVKMIFASKDADSDPMYGMVILMNNFIDKTAQLQEPTEKSILDYCKDDRCEETLNQKFKEVGGSVRCCSTNEDFKGLFRWKKITAGSTTPSNNSVQLLQIPGINEPDEGKSSEMDE